MARDALLVFLKRPRAGEAKTRLALTLGAEAAATLYRVLAEEEVRRTAPRAGEYDRLFFHSPPEACAEMESWFPGETWIPQEGGDLGARMATAFDHAFRRGGRRAALIGSDVPLLARETVLEALRSLDTHDIVLGPAADGGYYLVALDRPRPGLFQGIAWSTASVLAQTAERAGAMSLSVRMLAPLRDIDTLEDVRTEWDRLRPLLARQPGLAEAVEASLARPPRLA